MMEKYLFFFRAILHIFGSIRESEKANFTHVGVGKKKKKQTTPTPIHFCVYLVTFFLRSETWAGRELCIHEAFFELNKRIEVTKQKSHPSLSLTRCLALSLSLSQTHSLAAL